jgi:hypothetical protein
MRADRPRRSRIHCAPPIPMVRDRFEPEAVMSNDSAAKPCPYCNSSEVVEPAKASSSGYRRCRRCNEVWRPDRISANQAYANSTGVRTPMVGR